jgi:hypothetical protein
MSKTNLFVTLATPYQNLCIYSHFYSIPLYVVVVLGIGPGQSPLYRTGGRSFIQDLAYGFLRRLSFSATW